MPQSKVPRTILLVDDDTDAREAVAELIEVSLEDVRVIAAASGTQALEVLRSQHIDVMVTDYRMPGMDGVQLLDEAQRVAPTTVRIIITDFDHALLEHLGDRVTGLRIVHKPLDPKSFVETLRDAIA